jgi:pyrimidine-nucleoside phosphorylase
MARVVCIGGALVVFSPDMRAVDLIVKKRNKMSVSADEIQFLIDGYVRAEIPDYQISAFLMAVYFNGMNGAEAGALTRAMINSGTTMDLAGLAGPLVDKHSTGGVGDKVSLILAPIAAACGVQVPMMSGRALGHTGGTLDKLESITGYGTGMDTARFRSIIGDCGYAMTGQSEDIVPADRLLYALRDVTGTVESVPLITASIMSKKFAEGAQALVFDVKSGSGAFMKTLEDSRRLAQSLIDTGRSLERAVVAVITRMSEPLGYMVGNFLEVVESVYCLMGDRAPEHFTYPDDLMTVTLRLTAWMLVAGGISPSVEAAEARCRDAIADGSAYERFRCNVSAQGGDPDQLEAELAVRRAPVQLQLDADSDGVVTEIDAFQVGMAGVFLGAGRSKTDDDVLDNVGVELHKKVGDDVVAGDALCTIYAESQGAADEALNRVRDAYQLGSSAPQRQPLILDELSSL